MALLVLVVDRDDDLGVKAGIKGPVIGREEVLKAGEALLLSDPEDSDGNTIFAAIKIYDELRSAGEDVEVAVVTGDARLGLMADRKIKEALDEIFKKGRYEGIVFVSDGAEDDEVLPIISSYAPIISKKTVIVKQSQALERAVYTLRAVLDDPFFSRLLLGIPGIIILLWVFFQESAFRIILFVLGLYLVLRGFGLEEPLVNTLRSYLRFDTHSPAFPFQVLSWAVLVGGTFLAFHTFTYYPDPALSLYEALRLEGVVIGASIFLFLLGKTLEAFSRREAYKVGDYIVFGATVFVILVAGDSLLNFLEGRGNIVNTLVSVAVAVAIYYALTALGLFIRKSPLFTDKIRGAVVVDKTGVVLGKVKDIKEGAIIVERGRRRMSYPVSRVKIEGRRIVVS